MNDTLCTLRCFPTQVCLECVLKEPSHGMSTGSLSLSVSFKLPSSAAWVPVLSLRQPANAIDSKGFPYGRCQNRLSSSSLSAPAVHKQCALLSLSVAVGSCGRILSRQCTQSDSKSERTGRTKLGPPTRSADRLEQLEASLQRLKNPRGREGRWLPGEGVRKFPNEGRVGVQSWPQVACHSAQCFKRCLLVS